MRTPEPLAGRERSSAMPHNSIRSGKDARGRTPSPASSCVRACARVSGAGGVRSRPHLVGTQLGRLGPGSPVRPPRHSPALRFPRPGGAASAGLGFCGPRRAVRSSLWGQRGGSSLPARASMPRESGSLPAGLAAPLLRPRSPCRCAHSSTRSPGGTVSPAHLSNQRERSPCFGAWEPRVSSGVRTPSG